MFHQVPASPDECNIVQTVAIKTVKEQGLNVEALLEFEKEMATMTSLRHRHVVNLLGICTVTLPFFIVMEYMEHVGAVMLFGYTWHIARGSMCSDIHGTSDYVY